MLISRRLRHLHPSFNPLSFTLDNIRLGLGLGRVLYQDESAERSHVEMVESLISAGEAHATPFYRSAKTGLQTRAIRGIRFTLPLEGELQI